MTGKLLNYRVFGKGRPVLFLHGFLESNSMWLNLELESFNFQSIIIDLPGHGESLNEDDNEPSIEFMALKVQELVDHLDLKQFSVIGHSMGGYVALSIKELMPKLKKSKNQSNCSKVILLNSNFWEDSEVKKQDRIRVVDIVFKNKNLFIKEAIPNLFIDKVNYSNQINELINESLKMDKHAISYASLAMRNRKNKRNLLIESLKDFLLIQGAEDTIIPLEIMKDELSGLNVKCEIIEGVGHMTHIEFPDIVKKIIADFLIE